MEMMFAKWNLGILYICIVSVGIVRCGVLKLLRRD
jgi:hypothetical protein